jgi:hypothetical protein
MAKKYLKSGTATTKIDTGDYTKGGTAPAAGIRVNPNDVTTAAQATGPYRVDRQDARTRLWQSFDTTYNDAIRDSNRQYEQNYAQADLQAQSRGMGRSSYNNQTLANINTEKANAATRLNEQKIAAYQQALNNLEQQEQQQANWQAQMDQANQQFSQQMAMQFLGNILANNGNASDALLEQAGLSRADFEAMKRQQATGGGGGRFRNRMGDNGTNDNANPGSNSGGLYDFINNYYSGNSVYGNSGTNNIQGSAGSGGRRYRVTK